MNGSNFNLSSLLCSRGNVSCSKEPKYTSKSSSTHPYQRTYALSKQFQEIECQSNALFDEISEHARLVRHAHHFRTTCLFDAWLSWTWKCSLQRKFSAGFANKLGYGTSFVDVAEAKLFFSSSTLRALLIHSIEKHQHRPALVSSSKLFEILPPQRESDRLGEVAKPTVDAVKKT